MPLHLRLGLAAALLCAVAVCRATAGPVLGGVYPRYVDRIAVTDVRASRVAPSSSFNDTVRARSNFTGSAVEPAGNTRASEKTRRARHPLPPLALHNSTEQLITDGSRKGTTWRQPPVHRTSTGGSSDAAHRSLADQHVATDSSGGDKTPAQVDVTKPPLGPCCDDFDCASSGVDCDKELDCSVATCPPDPRNLGHGARLMSMAGVDADGDECNHRIPYGHECTCTCRCVCIYPSGEVVWLTWPTPEE